ncbi:hypothetical protein [Lentzea sp. E54]|uniref:hypothetical protein n=1 Tax=Lentzea xerophila TaxID=3435883 RepID=UPI003DA1DC85
MRALAGTEPSDALVCFCHTVAEKMPVREIEASYIEITSTPAAAASLDASVASFPIIKRNSR